ncbi:MAG: MOSC domain-containing protein [Candidatus Omnitrophica bacterium]|nr:MOSC domain-containing protein [Candidatus Omnitrophota bacterium]MBU4590390.1 MOSC domain-containing protein [Candidatus Omnitrophota bacterium]
MKGRVKSISTSSKKGCKKKNTQIAVLKEDFGIVGDAHGGGERQVSLLAIESIEKMRKKGVDVTSGDFAENITTSGMDLMSLKLGSHLKIGKSALLEITHIGKVCHDRCEIFRQVGDCVMPREGIFAKVLKGGVIKPRDRMEVVKQWKSHTL